MIIKFTLSGELLPTQISVKQPARAMARRLNSSKQKLKFDKFKLQIIKFLTKFAYHIKPKVVKTFVKSIIKAISLCQI